MGWVLVAVVGVSVLLLGLYSILKAGSDADDLILKERQYDED